MAAGQSGSGRTQLVPEAHKYMDNMKYEIASELGIPVYQGSEDYWGDIPAKDCGKVGGTMVKRMIAMAEQQIAQGHMPNKI
ncbi:spore protein [Fervidicella metallireducens AeB]|uniref:Spore protein n=1 Tax=Fervidicella metallireducens AeB TaxID=1403537 RepID=A0A017RTJ2_9CLOT|nr:alpha/beta-type small acid-soluble spore protein [Fervidicella metallireducens]EYE87784.1 spore protein [Fervidicella metallireducens AeB]